MTHLWIRAEERANERRSGLMPEGVAALRGAGLRVTVEESADRVVATEAYAAAGADIAPRGTWRRAPADALVFGLKELPEDGTPLSHRHIFFGHAFKGQPAGRTLLSRFRAGGGALYDLEYLVDTRGRRVAAFGHWAGFAGAAVSALAYAAQARGRACPPVSVWEDQSALVADVAAALTGQDRPAVLIIGAQGRVGGGAAALCDAVGLSATRWDVAETAHGGPFPEVLDHGIFLNCILAMPGVPVFVAADAGAQARALRVIGDIACDPTSDFSPIKVYDRVTDWAAPTLRAHDTPPLDVMAIDNLPSLLPRESSEDFAAQLLPHLLTLGDIQAGVWGRARAAFDRAMEETTG